MNHKDKYERFKQCRQCGKQFEPSYPSELYCSETCLKSWRLTYHKRYNKQRGQEIEKEKKGSLSYYEYRVRRKAYFVKLKGDKCAACGKQFPLACYDFHHINPKKGRYSKAITTLSQKEIIEEMEKVILLCSNCHRILHSKLKECYEGN
jgi:predicted HNH restriction endonuclease